MNINILIYNTLFYCKYFKLNKGSTLKLKRTISIQTIHRYIHLVNLKVPINKLREYKHQ